MMRRIPALCLSLFALGLAGFIPNPAPRLGDVRNPVDGPPQQLPLGDCPAQATVAACQDVRLHRLPCFRLSGLDDDCATLLRAELERNQGDFEQQSVPTIDLADDRAGFEQRDDTQVRFSGHEGTYAGAVVAGRAQRVDADGRDAGALDREQRQFWRDNCSIQSCDEYVYEKYFDYTVFEDRVGALGDDYRAIFDLAFAADGIARRPLKGRAGDTFGAIEPQATRTHQNHFLSFRTPVGWTDRDNFEFVDWRLVAALGGVAGIDADPAAVFEPGMTQAEFIAALVGPLGCFEDATRDHVACVSDDLNAAFAAATINLSVERAAALNAAAADLLPPPGDDPWTWHAEMSARMAPVFSDARMLIMDARQVEFQALVAARVRARAAVASTTATVLHQWVQQLDRRAEFEALLRDNVAYLTTLNREIAAALDAADALGCLEAGARTVCDWSPRWLADDIRDRFLAERAADFQRCIQLTGNNFQRAHDANPDDGTPLWLVEQAQLRGNFCVDADGAPIANCALRSSYVADERSIETYFATIDAWLVALDFPLDPETGAYSVQRSGSDRGDTDEALFGVSHAYDAGWAVDGLDSAAGPVGRCALRMRAATSLTLDAKAFGVNVAGALNMDHLFRMSALTPNGNNPRAVEQRGLFVELMGMELDPEPFSGTALQYSYASQPTKNKEKTLVEETYFVGGFPITLVGGIAGTSGVETTVDVDRTLCGPGPNDESPVEAEFGARLTTVVRPHLTAGVFGQAGVGIPGLQVGVRTDMQLLRVSLPFTIDLNMALAPEFELGTDTSLVLETTILSGTISLIVEYVIDSWKRRIYGWDGIKWTTELFRDEAPLPLTPFASGEAPVGVVQAVARFDAGRMCAEPTAIPDAAAYHDFNDDNTDPADGFLFAEQGNLTFEFGADQVETGQGAAIHGQAFDVLSGGLSAEDGRTVSADDGFTAALWFRPRLAGPRRTLLSSGPADQLEVVYDDGQLEVSVDCTDGRRTWPIDGPRGFANVGDWSHVAVSHDPALNGTFTAWLNGVAVVRVACTGVVGAGTHLRLGANQAGQQQYAGFFDEFTWWAEPFTDAQIDAIVERGQARRPVLGAGAALPSAVHDVRAIGTENAVLLRWSNPDLLGQPGGYAAVSVVASRAGYPRSDQDGVELLRGAGPDGFNHVGLTNGEPWFYAFFMHPADGGLPVPGPVVQATPTVEPPVPVVDLQAVGRARQIELTWTNAHVDGLTVIRRAIGRDPTLNDGAVLLAQAPDRMIDRDLEPGVEYRYAVYARDAAGNLSAPRIVSAIPLPPAPPAVPPPGQVTDVTVTVTADSVHLRWTLPDDFDASTVRVRRFGPLRHALLADAPIVELLDAGLQTDVRYTYTLTIVDDRGRHGESVTVHATPEVDPVPPVADFALSSNENEVRLSWTAPADDATIMLLRGFAPALTPLDGQLLYFGPDALFIDRPDHGRFTYTIFNLLDDGARFSAPRHLEGGRVFVPRPGPVDRLSAESLPGLVRLVWRSPGNLPVSIYRRELGGDDVLLATDQFESFVDRTATIGRVYLYTLIVVDEEGYESNPREIDGRPLPFADPVAVARSVDVAPTGDTVPLDGSESVDAITWRWRQVAGTPVTIVNADQPRAHFVAVSSPDAPRFSLTVTDARGGEGSVEIEVPIVAFEGLPLDIGALPFAEPILPDFPIQAIATGPDAIYVLTGEDPPIVKHLDADGAILRERQVASGSELHLDGDRLFVTGGRSQTTVLDLGSPLMSVRIFEPSTLGSYTAAFGGDAGAYTNVDGSRIAIVARDGTTLREQISFQPEFNRQVVDLVMPADGQFLYALFRHADQDGVRVIDVSDPDRPRLGAIVPLPAGLDADQISLGGGVLLVEAFDPADFDARQLVIYDLTDPAIPALRGQTRALGAVEAPAIHGDAAYVRQLDRRAGVGQLDLSDLDAPIAGPRYFPAADSVMTAHALWPPDAPTHLLIGGASGVRRVPLDTAPETFPSGLADLAPALVRAGHGRTVVLGEDALATVDLVDGVPALGDQVALPPATALGLALGADHAYAVRAEDQPTLRTIALAGEVEALGAVVLDFGCAALKAGSGFLALHCAFPPWAFIDLERPDLPLLVRQNDGGEAMVIASDPGANEVALIDDMGQFQIFGAEAGAPVLRRAGALAMPGQAVWQTMRDAPAVLRDRRLWVRAEAALAVYDLSADVPLIAPTLITPRDTRFGALTAHASAGLWATLGANGLSLYALADGQPTDQLRGAIALPPDATPRIASFPIAGETPDVQVPFVDGRALIAGDALYAVNVDRATLDGPLESPRVGVEHRYQLRWSRGGQVQCQTTSGECAVEAIDADAGTAIVRWQPLEAGHHSLSVTVGTVADFFSIQDRAVVRP